MGTGIGASLTTFSAGTTISSSNVNSNFSALNTGGVSNDSGSISTSGGGVITATGFTIGNSEHITLGGSSTLRFNSADALYVETTPGYTDIQAYGAGGKVVFKDSSGNSIAAINPGSHGLQFVDGSGVYRDCLYINTGAGELYIQMVGGGNLVVKDNNGNNMMHIDHSGNMVLKGTLTQNGTP